MSTPEIRGWVMFRWNFAEYSSACKNEKLDMASTHTALDPQFPVVMSSFFSCCRFRLFLINLTKHWNNKEGKFESISYDFSRKQWIADVFAWGNLVVNADFQNSFPHISLSQLLIDAPGCSNQCNTDFFPAEHPQDEELIILCCECHSQPDSFCR